MMGQEQARKQALGQLYVVSAASGAGKTSLLRELTSTCDDLEVSISHTTREIRPGEKDGRDYNFVDQQQFLQMQEDGVFLESAEVFGNYYGTSAAAVKQKLEQGIDIILEIDWQGARVVKACGLDPVTIFILPPSAQALRDRLQGRAQDSQEIIEDRLTKAGAENSHYNEYDYVIVNDDFVRAQKDLQAIIRCQRLSCQRQAVRHADLLRSLAFTGD